MFANFEKMLSDRGWKILPREDECFELYETGEGVAAVWLIVYENIRVKDIQLVGHKLAKLACKPRVCVVLYNRGISFGVKTMPSDVELQCIQTASIEIDPTTHILQPNFRALDEEKAQMVRKMYVHQMPLLWVMDPVAFWFNWKPGRVIHICENSHDEGKDELDWSSNLPNTLCPSCRFREVVKSVH